MESIEASSKMASAVVEAHSHGTTERSSKESGAKARRTAMEFGGL